MSPPLVGGWARCGVLSLALALASFSSCTCEPAPPAAVDASSGAPLVVSSALPVPGAAPRAPVREGSALVRSAEGDALYVADEDHRSVRRVPLPVTVAADASVRSVAVPGPPAQVLALAGRVLVTIRDPGLLLILRPDAEAGLVEVARVPLPADAWGLSVSADEKTALVSSAWTSRVSAVDLERAEVRWTAAVEREPRGIVVHPRGFAYVTHLVGASLTRIDDLAGPPRISRVDLPASALRAPSGKRLAASLGYAAALSDDGARLFVARHALGALGREAWFGAATVDVLLTEGDEPLAPPHHGNLPVRRSPLASQMVTSGADANLPMTALAPFTQPRALVFRRRTNTVLVAGEGDDRLVELDALAVDPTLAPMRTYVVGGAYDPHIRVAGSCGAPAGIALSADESTAWVFCRSTYDLATVALDPHAPGAAFVPTAPEVVRLADDPGGPELSMGRRLFHNATDALTSGGLACAGCHPEGRDDGFVWREATFVTASDGENTNFVGSSEQIPDEARQKGFARRTPMLAGRVSARGPYGWHAESDSLPERIRASFSLHRWAAMPAQHAAINLTARAHHLALFARRGLVPPPVVAAELGPRELRGREIFLSAEARCSTCHTPESEHTDRTAYPFPGWPQRSGFDGEPSALFKTPSLRFVAGRAPYFHDGSASSLEVLIERNGDRMGKTSHLSADDRAALVAYLRTL